MPNPAITALLIENNPIDADRLHAMIAELSDVVGTLIQEQRLAPALQQLAAGGIDVVLLDLALPDAQGLTSLAAAQAVAPEIPIVVLTDLADETVAREAVQQGAQDYLVKAELGPRWLGRALRYAIERKRVENEHAQRVREHAASQRLAFLARISTQLAASLDYATTLATIAQVGVPTLAEWCAVEVLAIDGLPQQHAIAHADPSEGRVLEAAWSRTPSLRAVFELDQILYGAGAVVLPATAERAATAIGVPLIAREQVIGVLLFVRSTPAKYGPDDLALAQELGRRAAVAIENARLYHEAQEAIRLRDEFLSLAAHELRTPLAVLVGNAQLLERRLQRNPDLTERERRNASVINEQAMRLHHLIESLLDLGRMQSGRLDMDYQVMDVCELVDRVVREFQPTLEQHTLTLVCSEGEIMINGDLMRLEQVLQNLLENAVKYSPQGGTISVELRSSAREVTIAISDQGIGIPQTARDQLFERFYRAPNVKAVAVKGLGIGLAVVKDVINHHHGTVAVESTEGEGSTFTVTLPLIIAAEQAHER